MSQLPLPPRPRPPEQEPGPGGLVRPNGQPNPLGAPTGYGGYERDPVTGNQTVGGKVYNVYGGQIPGAGPVAEPQWVRAGGTGEVLSAETEKLRQATWDRLQNKPNPQLDALRNQLNQQPQPPTSRPPTFIPPPEIPGGGAGGNFDGQGSQEFQNPNFQASLSRLSAPSTVQGPNFKGGEQQAALQSRLQDLLAGKQVDIGDVSKDAEARAYRVAKMREMEGLRQQEADRLGASGMTGSGDFDARVAGIREQTGEAIAQQVAGLTGRRQAQAQEGAIRGAQLTLSDLDRQAGNEMARYRSDFEREQAGRDREAQRFGAELDLAKSKYGSQVDSANRSERMGLAAQEDAWRRTEGAYRAEADRYAADQGAYRTRLDSENSRNALQAQLLQMQLQDQARQQEFGRSAPTDNLRNILLQQEIMKNKKLSPKIDYPTGGYYGG